MTKPAAVLTGDIVRSGDLSAAELDRLFDVLSRGVDAIKAWPGNAGSVGLERNRGDGWQALLAEPKWALRACLVLRAGLIAQDAGFDTRIAVGVGAVSHLSPDGLEASDGEAFRRSGRALDAMKSSSLLAIDVEGAATNLGLLMDAVFQLCDSLASGWTTAQAEVMALALLPDAPRQVDIGRTLDSAQQTIQKHFSRAGGPAIQRALAAFEALGFSD